MALMDRRNFLKKSLLTLSGIVCTGSIAKAAEASGKEYRGDNRLNVLFIAVDDLRPQLGCYGDDDAVTPHIDRLARRGMVFKRAYCQMAVCNPSRSSLMTGRRPDTIGVWDLKTHFRENVPDVVTLPEHFKKHGYHTECIGKIYHDPPGHRDPNSWSTPELLDDTREVRGKYVLEENLKIYQPDGRRGREKAAATEAADVPDNAYIDGRVADKAIQRLNALGAKEKPFFLAVGFRRPHLPFSAPRKYWDMQKPEHIAHIANPFPPEDVPQIALHDGREIRGYTDIPDMGEISQTQSAHLRHGYYAAISYIDAQIGKLLDELDRLALSDKTVICLWGDHGFHLGEHGLWGKTTNFELDTRSPLIFAVPHQKTAGRSTRSLAEFIDIYPTLADVCGLPAAEGLEGHSLAAVLNNPNATVRDYAVSQFVRPVWTGKIMGYSLRTDRYRYTEWMDRNTGETIERELYDHDEDSLETVNLAGRQEYMEIVYRQSVSLRKIIGVREGVGLFKFR